jgi:diguanylate cyclase (GGDEF)-like protein/PAS domain S-box-containing protein
MDHELPREPARTEPESSERQNAETDLRKGEWAESLEKASENEKKYKSAFDQSPTGMEIYNANGKLIDINRAALDIFGVERIEDVLGFDLLNDPNLSETNRSKVAMGQPVNFETEFDFDLVKESNLYKTSKSGKLSIDCLITPLVTSQNTVSGYFLHVRDVTQRKMMAEALELSERRFRALIEHSTDAISLIDAHANVIYESPSVEKLTGYDPRERLGRNGLELVVPEDHPMLQRIMVRVITQPNHVENANFRSIRKDGTVWWTESTAINLLNEPSVQAIVVNYRDVTERINAEKALKTANDQLNFRIREVEELQSELREQALRDPLTGLYNRRHLGDAMDREMARMQREKQPLSTIIMDIDHFKKVNDKHGHQIGDQFLTEIAKVIAGHARSSDIACRYGGEEFLLVLPGATLKTAMKRAELIREQCEAIQIMSGKKIVKVTMSMGVAAFPKHGKGAEEIVVKADKAMYRAKRAGRNCVMAWE